jgi:exosome complex RNA-binding protein Csl4
VLIPLEANYLIWANTHKIRVIKANCPKCHKDIITNIPFAIKGYRGLKSEDHGCGEKYTRKIAVPYSEEEKNYWATIALKM